MRQIAIQALSEQAFRRFGAFQDLLDDASLAQASVNPRGFFADVVKMEFGGSLQPSVSVNSLRRDEKMLVRFLEFHRHTCEGILPIDGDVVLFVGIPARGKLTPDTLEAFRVPKGTFVRLDPLITHGVLFPVDETAHALCLLPARTFANDMEARLLTEEEQVELVFPNG